MKFDALIEHLEQNRALLTLLRWQDQSWEHAQIVEVQPGQERIALYELGARYAELMATQRGGQIERYREVV